MPLNPYESPTTPPDEGPTKPPDASAGSKLLSVMLRLAVAYGAHGLTAWCVYAMQVFLWDDLPNLDHYFGPIILFPLLDVGYVMVSVFLLPDPISSLSTLAVLTLASLYLWRGTWPYLLLMSVATIVQYRNVYVLVEGIMGI